MKKFILSVALCLITSISSQATDKVTFTRLAYDEGTYLYRTFATTPETPYATMIWPDEDGENPFTWEIILLSEDVKPVYSFKVNAPEDHNYCRYLGFTDSHGNYIDYILVTQHLFNDDDLYEIVFRGRVGDYDYSSWIYNENGEFLGEIPEKARDLYQHGDQLYFYAEYDEGSNNNTVGALYAINKAVNSVTTVAADKSQLAVTPNPADYGQNVTLTLPEQLTTDTEIRVFSTDGALLMRKDCKKGEEQVMIPAYRLGAGVNPVVVIDPEGNILATGKIIRE